MEEVEDSSHFSIRVDKPMLQRTPVNSSETSALRVVPPPEASCLSLCGAYTAQVLPIARWLPTYNLKFALGDLLSGLTVGVMAIPQVLAYAKIVSLPVQFGLYSAYIGAIMYTLMGTSKDISIGPTAVVSLLIGETLSDMSNEEERIILALTLSLVSGMIQMVMGFLKLGVIADLISKPVISGFISSVSISVSINQMHHFFGTRGSNKGFIKSLQNTFTDFVPSIKEHWPDLILGIICLVFAFGLRFLGSRYKDNKIIWSLATGRNVIVVGLSALVAFIFYKANVQFLREEFEGSCDGESNDPYPCSPFILTGYVPSGLAGTVKIPLASWELIRDHLSDIIVIVFVSYLETISVAKAFSKKDNYKIDTSQELIAVGAANFFNSFFSGFPVTGSFSRSAVQNQSGSFTPMANIYNALLLLLAAHFLTGVFYWIPTTSLAAIIISAVLPMFEYDVIIELWKTDKGELFIWLISFLGCLFLGVEYGMIGSVGLSILYLLFSLSRPGEYFDVVPKTFFWKFVGPMAFHSSSNFSTMFWERYEELSKKVDFEKVLFDCAYITFIDSSGLEEIEGLCTDLRRRKVEVHFVNVPPVIRDAMAQNGVLDHIGDSFVHFDLPTALSTIPY